MSKPTSVEMAERHAREIETIIADGREKQMHLAGAELAAARRACSTAIAEACGRHIAEANELSRNVAADKPAIPDKPATPPVKSSLAPGKA